MVFTSKALLALSALVPAAFAIPGPSWYKRQADAQTSLTLDPASISPGLAQDGQGNNPDPAQVRSLTSKNNFINFCLTQNTALTNGQQNVDGSCNPTPMGRIISFDQAPSSKFVFPKNTDSTIEADQPFTIQMKVRNMVLGNFVNAQSNYYAAPQQVNQQGLVIGHTHVVIEPIPSFDVAEPLNPLTFAFFKGVNGAANGDGIVTASVDKGVPAGFYRLCSINTAANHQPVLVSNAQHGALDDCVYFAVGQGDDPFKLQGGNNANATASASASESASDTAAASSSSAPAATQSAAAGQNDNQNNNQIGGNNQQQQGGNNNPDNNQQGGNQQGGNDANNANNANNANADAQGGNGANNNNQRQGGGNNN